MPQPGGPADSTSSPSNSGTRPAAPNPDGDVPGEPRPAEYPCPNCQRSFSTRTGLGVHRRRAHPEDANNEVLLPSVKVRWSDEELLLMARLEAAAVMEGVRFVNQHLLQLVPSRTLESIKGVRRRGDYKRMVKAATEDRRAMPAIPASPPPGAPRPDPEVAEGSPAVSTMANEMVPPSESSDVEMPDHPAPIPSSPSRPPRRSSLGCSIRPAVQGLINSIRDDGRHHFQVDLLLDTATRSLNGEDVEDSLRHWFRSAVAPEPRRPRTQPARSGGFRRPHRRPAPPVPMGPTAAARPPRPQPPPLSRRARRRKEYAILQQAFRRCPGRAAKEVLEGGPKSVVHSLEEMAQYWNGVMERESHPYAQPVMEMEDPRLSFLVDPISCEECATVVPSTSTAPGPDDVTVRQWLAVPSNIRALLYNVVLLDGGFPEEVLASRTVFVPKKQEPEHPGDYRPISIASVAVRQLHRILALRVSRAALIDLRQRAFITSDGTAENTCILDACLSDARTRLREIHMATLDLSKAFDSISHYAIDGVMKNLGMPLRFRRYVMGVYERSHTHFQVRGAVSNPVPVRRGVRQGDPLSPILFNLAVNTILAAVPEEVGYTIEGKKINALAFADDLVIITGSRWGLQTALSAVEDAASALGLMLNPEKSSTFSLVPDGKRKKVKIVSDIAFRLRGDRLRPSTVVSRWKYLGVEFDAHGTTNFEQDLAGVLANISRAPLKPQQRLRVLTTSLLPKFYHLLTLGRVTRARLESMDNQIRKVIRRWLRLPNDVPMGYFYAAVKDGGLGVPCLRTLVPCMVAARIDKLVVSNWDVAVAIAGSTKIKARRRWATKAMRKEGVDPVNPSPSARKQLWASRLHESVDGRELRESARSSPSTSWVVKTSNAIPGRDYVQYHHVRINALPSKIRTSRGTRRAARQIQCRAGCNSTETAAHVIQCCWRTHGGRVKRHNAVCATLAAALRQKGHTVEEEPHFRTAAGLRKPDLVSIRENKANVIDAQIVSGSGSLHAAHLAKRAYYADHLELQHAISDRYGVPPHNIETTTCTISWRGVWCKKSHDDLAELGLSEGTMGSLTTRVLQGSSTNWGRFNRMTATIQRHPRAGVG